jgi:hypothetical protein
VPFELGGRNGDTIGRHCAAKYPILGGECVGITERVQRHVLCRAGTKACDGRQGGDDLFDGRFDVERPVQGEARERAQSGYFGDADP